MNKSKYFLFFVLFCVSKFHSQSSNEIYLKLKKLNFTHPYFNLETLRAQKELHSLQGINRTWYCGSYFGYGFHEDGINSSLNLIKNFKIK